MPSTFEIVAGIIARTCCIPLNAITPTCHLLNDLGIDSLDLLDVGFALDDAFGVTIDLGERLHAVHLKRASAERYFVMRDFCANIEMLIASPGVTGSG